MRSESIVAVFTILVMAIGISISALGASSHGSLATEYTIVLIGFGLFVVAGFAIAAFIQNSKKGNTSLR
jgi:hypothetical protein